MIIVDETEPVGDSELSFPYHDVTIKRGVDAKQFYDIIEEIGRGKFGTVYKCREKTTGYEFAAKYISIPRREDKRNVECEVEIMNSLQHPKIIQIYDAYEYCKNMWVILELIEGGELFERVIDDNYLLTEKACKIILRQVCEAMQFVHQNSIVHLDLKPENILCLTREGNIIKIIDFGLARRFDPDKKLKVLFGTPEFVAPEVVNFDTISFGTDMWSIGVISYVLLSGLSPFMGDTDIETMTNVTIAKYDFDDEAFNDVSPEALDFVSKLLVKDINHRMTAAECLQHPWLKRRYTRPSLTQKSPSFNLITPKKSQSIEDKHFAELKKSKENLKEFVERWDEQANNPYIFDREINYIAPVKIEVKANSNLSSRGCSPSPCESMSSNSPDQEDIYDDTSSLSQLTNEDLLNNGINNSTSINNNINNNNLSSDNKLQNTEEIIKNPEKLEENPNLIKDYLNAFDRRNSDSKYLMNDNPNLIEKINLADEIKKLSEHLLRLSQMNFDLGTCTEGELNELNTEQINPNENKLNNEIKKSDSCVKIEKLDVKKSPSTCKVNSIVNSPDIINEPSEFNIRKFRNLSKSNIPETLIINNEIENVEIYPTPLSRISSKAQIPKLSNKILTPEIPLSPTSKEILNFTLPELANINENIEEEIERIPLIKRNSSIELACDHEIENLNENYKNLNNQNLKLNDKNNLLTISNIDEGYQSSSISTPESIGCVNKKSNDLLILDNDLIELDCKNLKEIDENSLSEISIPNMIYDNLGEENYLCNLSRILTTPDVITTLEKMKSPPLINTPDIIETPELRKSPILTNELEFIKTQTPEILTLPEFYTTTEFTLTPQFTVKEEKPIITIESSNSSLSPNQSLSSINELNLERNSEQRTLPKILPKRRFSVESESIEEIQNFTFRKPEIKPKPKLENIKSPINECFNREIIIDNEIINDNNIDDEIINIRNGLSNYCSNRRKRLNRFSSLDSSHLNDTSMLLPMYDKLEEETLSQISNRSSSQTLRYSRNITNGTLDNKYRDRTPTPTNIKRSYYQSSRDSYLSQNFTSTHNQNLSSSTVNWPANRRPKHRITYSSRDVPILPNGLKNSTKIMENPSTTKDCLLQLLDKYDKTIKPGKLPINISRHQSIATDFTYADNFENRTMNSLNAFFHRYTVRGNTVKSIQAQFENGH